MRVCQKKPSTAAAQCTPTHTPHKITRKLWKGRWKKETKKLYSMIIEPPTRNEKDVTGHVDRLIIS